MFRKLKIDKIFIPCPVDDGDEMYPNGIFVFNVSKLIKYIEKSGDDFPLHEVDVESTHSGFEVIDEKHIKKVDISKPIILAEIAPERFNVIDGNHRLEKAKRDNVKALKAYRIGPEVHTKFLTSKDSYFKYVAYWNEKLKSMKDVGRLKNVK